MLELARKDGEMVMVGRLALATTFVAALTSAATSMAQTRSAAPEAQECILTAADLVANSRLTFRQFDQGGVTPATARKLGERKCYAEAAKATEHFLIHGPVLNAFERNVVTWHLGQYLASSGNEHAAAHVIASTRRPVDPARPDFDWNTYVAGTWAFLVKDRALLEASLARLSAASPRNANNAGQLARLLRCFDQSYEQSYESAACAAPAR